MYTYLLPKSAESWPRSDQLAISLLLHVTFLTTSPADKCCTVSSVCQLLFLLLGIPLGTLHNYQQLINCLLLRPVSYDSLPSKTASHAIHGHCLLASQISVLLAMLDTEYILTTFLYLHTVDKDPQVETSCS